jgi:hypothetical protein
MSVEASVMAQQFYVRDQFYERTKDYREATRKKRRDLFIDQMKKNYPLFCWEINSIYHRRNTRFHDQIMNAFHNPEFLWAHLECFRGAAKTMYAILDALHTGWTLDNRFMIYSSGNEPQTKSGMNKANRIIDRVPFLKDSVVKQQKMEIEFDTGSTLTGLTYASAQRGFGNDVYRVTDYYGDDIIPDRPKMRISEYTAIWRAAIENAIEPGGRLFNIGTPRTVNDVHATLRNDTRYYNLKIPIFDKYGQSVWEERYPTKAILQIQLNTDAVSFAREWLVEPMNPMGNKFKKIWLIDHLNRIPKEYYGMMHLFVDMAVSESKHADYVGIIQVYHSVSGKWYIIDSWNPKGINDAGELIVQLEPFVDHIMIEAPGTIHQMCMLDPNFQKLPPQKTDYIKSVKGNKIERILSLEPWFKKGLILYDLHKAHQFQVEYTSFPEGTDFHILDALQMGIKHFSGYYKNLDTNIYGIDFDEL